LLRHSFSRHQAASSPHDKTNLQRQIEATGRQIGALVYELYGPTEEESKLWRVHKSLAGIPQILYT